MLWLATVLAGTDGIPDLRVEHHTPTRRWSLENQVLYRNGEPVVERVIGRPSFRGDRVAVAAVLIEPVHTGLYILDGSQEPVLLDLLAEPDRLTLSPDGQHIAFVSGHTGWASVYILDLVARGEPEQLTNTVVVRQKGGPPLHFTPAPASPVSFQEDFLVWTDGRGEPHRVRWR